MCTRKSKECFWTAVNHVSSALSAVVFTPAAFVVWFALDNTAVDQSLESIAELTTPTADGLPFGRWALLLGATLTGFLGLALQTLGYQREEAAKASVMTILEIPFAYLLQAAVFHDEVSLRALHLLPTRGACTFPPQQPYSSSSPNHAQRLHARVSGHCSRYGRCGSRVRSDDAQLGAARAEGAND